MRLRTIEDPAIPAVIRDGYEVHRAALRHGLNVLLYPRQVMMTRPAEGGPELSFVHGIPQTSSLAAVTYAQDKRMRRELLERAGLLVPPGGSFAIGRELDEALAFASEIGYPVVVKPAVGDNISESLVDIGDEQQLREAIAYLRQPELERPSFTRSAYGLTLLLEPEEEDGRTVAPAGYQFLLERQVQGNYLRLVVLGEEIISAIHCADGPTPTAGDKEVTDELHPSLRALATAALRTIPELPLAAIDVVLTDHRRPVDEQQVWIVELSERPWLSTQAAISEHASQRIGEAILQYEANAAGLSLPPSKDDVSVEFLIEGATNPEAVVSAIAAAAADAGLTKQVSVLDRVDGTVNGNLHGSADHIARLFELLVAGELDGQRAMLVDARHL